MADRPRLGLWGSLLVVRMGFWRLVLPVAKRAVPIDRLARWTATPRQRQRDPERELVAERVAGRLWRSSAGPCLERSLALHRELGRLGALPTLVLGVASADGTVAGHAWVELDGRKLLEAETTTDRWAVVVRYDPAGARDVSHTSSPSE